MEKGIRKSSHRGLGMPFRVVGLGCRNPGFALPTRVYYYSTPSEFYLGACVSSLSRRLRSGLLFFINFWADNDFLLDLRLLFLYNFVGICGV